ncbi:DMT family transporter [Roseicella frigidaeris]|uniref:EamA/RhaT family transporter n=1 Tax=Roseicella frigidaeris TaxID=2230885 RepID=A0A327M6D6_9PROT|nr:DMT family transporter [Roseicella frigidaeris]RAI58861.1 EamA/RhaT family transporter [Roseicella frigidaeris]
MPFDSGPAPRGQAAGILLMLAAVLLFSLNDVLGKWLVASYAVGQVLVLRSLAALAALSPLAWRRLRAARFRAERPGLQALRVALGAGEASCFYWSVGHMPLADAMTYWMAAPVMVAGLSALLLGERVDARRGALVLLGFAGVAIALGADFTGPLLPSLVALGGALLYALFLLCSRQLRATPDVLLATFQMLGGLALGLALLGAGGWRTPDATDLALLLLLGLAATLGHVGVTRALKLAPASVVVPYQYSFLLWAALFGWLVWGDLPGLEMLAGAALIVGAGLLLYREQWRG